MSDATTTGRADVRPHRFEGNDPDSPCRVCGYELADNAGQHVPGHMPLPSPQSSDDVRPATDEDIELFERAGWPLAMMPSVLARLRVEKFTKEEYANSMHREKAQAEAAEKALADGPVCELCGGSGHLVAKYKRLKKTLDESDNYRRFEELKARVASLEANLADAAGERDSLRAVLKICEPQLRERGAYNTADLCRSALAVAGGGRRQGGAG